jgi:hypothetical protein
MMVVVDAQSLKVLILGLKHVGISRATLLDSLRKY